MAPLKPSEITYSERFLIQSCAVGSANSAARDGSDSESGSLCAYFSAEFRQYLRHKVYELSMALAVYVLLLLEFTQHIRKDKSSHYVCMCLYYRLYLVGGGLTVRYTWKRVEIVLCCGRI